ncbi:VHS domain-containing protein [Meloidogyne graminicola]|uniref:VHS domain-containing protein n=1 Tax=Meloidogyne graminicola TaxID=189291 RepID=A0A8S9ZXI0_9BILA|nr:VHS domain-containing protein [Meloidogyne graminicola]
MPIFGDSSPYDEIVEKVTADTLTSENWELMIDICDRVNADEIKGCKQCLLSVKKRLNHRDPHVVLLALSLLDCLWSNCGQKFRREVSSKEFIGELNYKCTNVGGQTPKEQNNPWTKPKNKRTINSPMNVKTKIDFVFLISHNKKGPLNPLIVIDLSFETDPSLTKKKVVVSNDPNVVTSDQEQADIARAIALSLQESGGNKQNLIKTNNNSNSYPTLPSVDFNSPNINLPNSLGKQPSTGYKQARALYDFEAVEDNEISFSVGEMINVCDDSDQNWWRGVNSRGVNGLFPASFVTTDLTQEISNIPVKDQNENIEETTTTMKVQIDEDILLKCIELIEDLDPSLDASSDPPELLLLENKSMAQAPLIDQKLMQIDKQLNSLATVDLAIRDVLGAYDNAVQQVVGTSTTTTNTNIINQQQQHLFNTPNQQQIQIFPTSSIPPIINQQNQQHISPQHWQQM